MSLFCSCVEPDPEVSIDLSYMFCEKCGCEIERRSGANSGTFQTVYAGTPENTDGPDKKS